ncbi:MAG: RDD family protein [Anaerolineae bacterium]
MQYCPYLSPYLGLIFAGFWRRLIAAVVDLLLVLFASFVLVLIVSPVLLAAPASLERFFASEYVSFALVGAYLVLGWLYFAGFEASESQATIGKTALGIMVSDLRGDRVGFGRASLRYLGKLISLLTLGIGFLIMLRHPRKQALHDRIAGTVVIINLSSPLIGPV